jgi:hypothetical protein
LGNSFQFHDFPLPVNSAVRMRKRPHSVLCPPLEDNKTRY